MFRKWVNRNERKTTAHWNVCSHWTYFLGLLFYNHLIYEYIIQLNAIPMHTVTQRTDTGSAHAAFSKLILLLVGCDHVIYLHHRFVYNWLYTCIIVITFQSMAKTTAWISSVWDCQIHIIHRILYAHYTCMLAALSGSTCIHSVAIFYHNSVYNNWRRKAHNKLLCNICWRIFFIIHRYCLDSHLIASYSVFCDKYPCFMVWHSIENCS